MPLFVGDDWADPHDIHLMDTDGTKLASRRLSEGLAGIRQFHELVAAHAEEPAQVVIGIETDRGLGVDALPGPAIRCSRSTRSRPPPGIRSQVRPRRRHGPG